MQMTSSNTSPTPERSETRRSDSIQLRSGLQITRPFHIRSGAELESNLFHSGKDRNSKGRFDSAPEKTGNNSSFSYPVRSLTWIECNSLRSGPKLEGAIRFSSGVNWKQLVFFTSGPELNLNRKYFFPDRSGPHISDSIQLRSGRLSSVHFRPSSELKWNETLVTPEKSWIEKD